MYVYVSLSLYIYIYIYIYTCIRVYCQLSSPSCIHLEIVYLSAGADPGSDG